MVVSAVRDIPADSLLLLCYRPGSNDDFFL
jgi:hypothetical protein